MIPDFNDDGYLPPGVHRATLEEIAARFGTNSELRRVQMESLRWLVDLAIQVGAVRIVVNGSFTTDKLEPNDVDCILLAGSRFPLDASAQAELAIGLPFINMEIVDAATFDHFVNHIYGTDRDEIPKGVIEVVL
jgi:hypothetical protein